MPLSKHRRKGNAEGDMKTWHKWVLIVYVVAMVVSFVLVPILTAEAFDIDMKVIAEIESGTKADAYNSDSGATGMYQITQICLAEYNNLSGGVKFTMADMYVEGHCWRVADWYMNERIPQLLYHYSFDDTIDNRIKAYNWGIGNMRRFKGGVIPKETRKYIIKYKNLSNVIQWGRQRA